MAKEDSRICTNVVTANQQRSNNVRRTQQLTPLQDYHSCVRFQAEPGNSLNIFLRSWQLYSSNKIKEA